ncbi:hypothetical protein SESBI_10657 [Sesbania bispinosa]|nr:hypothetical protein SESBI_10657 [Sesbania bispinosa]
MKREAGEGGIVITSVRMGLVAIALVLMLMASFCMAKDRRNLALEMNEHNQVSDQNDHHNIPRKDYGKPGSGQFDVTDDNDHHYIPRDRYGKPGGSGQLQVADNNDHHSIPRRDYDGTHTGNE